MAGSATRSSWPAPWPTTWIASLSPLGPHPACYREPGGLKVRVLKASAYMGGHPAHPIAMGLPAALAGADLVHTHHLRSLPSRVAAITARLLNRKLAVTDHGLQGGDWLGLLPRMFHRFLAVSAYSARELNAPAARTSVIYGGADPSRYAPDRTAGAMACSSSAASRPTKGSTC